MMCSDESPFVCCQGLRNCNWEVYKETIFEWGQDAEKKLRREDSNHFLDVCLTSDESSDEL